MLTHNTPCHGHLNVQSVQGHPEEVYACEFVDQKHLLSASTDTLYFWNIETDTCLQKASGMPSSQHQGELHVPVCGKQVIILHVICLATVYYSKCALW